MADFPHDSRLDASETTPQIHQRGEGNGNQSINQNFGNVFNNVRGDVNFNQPQPKILSLHRLPADISDFTGRKDEINTLLINLRARKTSNISTISGMAGVGKSVLAVHVAHLLARSDFPDVQFHIDLRGADGSSLEPTDILAQWLRAFGLNESSIPQSLQERSSVYRSCLHGQRAIVVLDNARDEAQVRPLLPGSETCAVLVTSRRALGALEGAANINLSVMTELESLELLQQLIGEERVQQELTAAENIFRLCGRLPLAIRIAGGTLKTKRHWNLSDYVQRLTDEKQRLKHLNLSDLDVRSSFELSYRELSDTDATLFAKLGILEGKDFSADIADVLMDNDDESLEILERLASTQLLEASLGERYQFHDLIRIYAREKLDESISSNQKEELKQKIVHWWVSQSMLWDRLLSSETRQEILIWKQFLGTDFIFISPELNEQDLPILVLHYFEQEREHLLSAFNWANRSELWDSVVCLAENLLDFFTMRSYWQDCEQTCSLAVEAAQNLNDFYREGVALNNLGIAYQNQNRWDNAEKVYQRGLNSCNYLSGYEEQYVRQLSLNNLSTVYRLKNRWDEALDYGQQSLSICERTGDSHGKSLALNNIGTIYLDRSCWSEAIEFFQKSIEICDDRHMQGMLLNNLGAAYRGQGFRDKASENFEQSLVTGQCEVFDRN
jgi:tetratricopeptide (TPR) repeat protein